LRSLLFIFTCSIWFIASVKHEYHVGIYDIYYKEQKFQLVQKLFVDDFEKALNLSGRILKFGDDINEIELSEAMQSYISDHFKLSLDKVNMDLKFVGAEMEDYHTVFLYWESEAVYEEFKEIEVFNNIFLEVSQDQQNMHRFYYGEKESSLLLHKDRINGTIKL
jgi:hypothetical protein